MHGIRATWPASVPRSAESQLVHNQCPRQWFPCLKSNAVTHGLSHGEGPSPAAHGTAPMNQKYKLSRLRQPPPHIQCQEKRFAFYEFKTNVDVIGQALRETPIYPGMWYGLQSLNQSVPQKNEPGVFLFPLGMRYFQCLRQTHDSGHVFGPGSAPALMCTSVDQRAYPGALPHIQHARPLVRKACAQTGSEGQHVIDQR